MWYLAQEIEQHRQATSADLRRSLFKTYAIEESNPSVDKIGSLVWVNYFLYQAHDAEAAYKFAMETHAEPLEVGEVVQTFVGLRDLTLVGDELKHGSILFSEILLKDAATLLRPKEKFNVYKLTPAMPEINQPERPSYIPKDAAWYLSEMVKGDGANAQIDLILIEAHLPDEAYQKAVVLCEARGYLGLRDISVIDEELEHECEIIFDAYEDVSDADLAKMIKSKVDLSVFRV